MNAGVAPARARRWWAAPGPSAAHHRAGGQREPEAHPVQRTHILGGVLAAALLTGGGAALGVALAGPPVPATLASAASSAAPAPAGIGTAALSPGTALVDGAGRA